MKKLLSVVLCGALVILLFGCNDKTSDKTNSTTYEVTEKEIITETLPETTAPEVIESTTSDKKQKTEKESKAPEKTPNKPTDEVTTETPTITTTEPIVPDIRVTQTPWEHYGFVINNFVYISSGNNISPELSDPNKPITRHFFDMTYTNNTGRNLGNVTLKVKLTKADGSSSLQGWKLGDMLDETENTLTVFTANDVVLIEFISVSARF